MVKINNIDTFGNEIYVKLEGSNPGRSTKDRIALKMIEEAEKEGLIDKDTVAYAVNNRVHKRSLSEPEVVSQWLDLRRFCDGSISRLNYKQSKLAFVCNK